MNGVAQWHQELRLSDRRPRMTRSFKKARLRWSEDGRRVYFDDEGEEMDPFRGRRNRWAGGPVEDGGTISVSFGGGHP